MDKPLSVTEIEEMVTRFLREAGFDPAPAGEEIAALANRLASPGEDPTKVPYDRLLEMAKELPGFYPCELGGAYVVIGTVNNEGKHYRVWKAWATVDGEPIWSHPQVRELKTWRGQAVQEAGYPYYPGSEDELKRYVSVYWVPPGKTVAITQCQDDLYRGRRYLSTQRYHT
ncbi:MAG: hypothetical protein ACPLRW_13345 [Moorellales bacterium]